MAAAQSWPLVSGVHGEIALVPRDPLGVRYYPVASIIAKQKANQRYYY